MLIELLSGVSTPELKGEDTLFEFPIDNKDLWKNIFGYIFSIFEVSYIFYILNSSSSSIGIYFRDRTLCSIGDFKDNGLSTKEKDDYLSAKERDLSLSVSIGAVGTLL